MFIFKWNSPIVFTNEGYDGSIEVIAQNVGDARAYALEMFAERYKDRRYFDSYEFELVKEVYAEPVEINEVTPADDTAEGTVFFIDGFDNL